MNKYRIEIYWSDADDCFLTKVPDLPGCIAHGETEEEALSTIKELIEIWLEIAKEDGKQIPLSSGVIQ
jgi:predicted RNase H-like HicB family nuclease